MNPFRDDEENKEAEREWDEDQAGQDRGDPGDVVVTTYSDDE